MRAWGNGIDEGIALTSSSEQPLWTGGILFDLLPETPYVNIYHATIFNLPRNPGVLQQFFTVEDTSWVIDQVAEQVEFGGAQPLSFGPRAYLHRLAEEG